MTGAFGPVRQLLFGVIVFLLGAGVAVVAGGEGDGGGPTGIGPAPGTRLEAYAEDRRAVLAGTGGTRRAVVSFDAYLDAGTARGLVGHDVVTFLVAAPGAAPEVTEDPGAWAGRRARTAREEVAAFDSLIPTVEDPEFALQYRQDRERALRTAEALEAGEPVVFAAVVRAPAPALRTLARARGVRLVDLAEAGATGTPRGLRPEERVVAGQPSVRP